MIRSRWIQVLGSLTLSAALAACSTSTSSPDGDKDDVAVEETTQTDDALKHPADRSGKKDRPDFDRAGRGGPIQILRQALDGMDLTADQKTTIDKAFADAKPERGSRDKSDDQPEAYRAFFDEVASQIRANHVDKASLLTKAAGLQKPAADPLRASMARTLQTVHDTLTPEQRAKLATELTGKLDALGGHMDKLGKRDAKRQGGMGGKGLGFLLRGVAVSAEQQASIETALDKAGLAREDADLKKAGEEMTAKMKALLEAFKGEKFDAAALLPEGPMMKGNHLETMIKSLEVVVPLLDEAQRNELADRIQKGMDGGKHGPGGPGGGDKKHRRDKQD